MRLWPAIGEASCRRLRLCSRGWRAKNKSRPLTLPGQSAVSFRSSGLWLYYSMLGFFHGVGSDSIKLSDRNAADLEKQVLASIVRDIFIH